MLILHYTGMESALAALARMCDKAAAVSAHYMIDEDGTITRLVAEEMRAWHAGISSWAGAADLNDRSIGIELVNPGHEFGYRDFPESQMAALTALAVDIVARHAIPAPRVLGHSDIAPDRKTDPGERFDWPRLARNGIGVWPDPVAPAGAVPDAAETRELLGRYGYCVGDGAAGLAETVTAFQRHFRPDRVDGVMDAETFARLEILCARHT